MLGLLVGGNKRSMAKQAGNSGGATDPFLYKRDSGIACPPKAAMDSGCRQSAIIAVPAILKTAKSIQTFGRRRGVSFEAAGYLTPRTGVLMLFT